jgi:hypothetical protein
MTLLFLSAALLAAGSAHGATRARAGSDTAQCAPSERRMDVTSALEGQLVHPTFANGEELHYAASFEKLHVSIHVGGAEMRFVGRDTIRGHVAWKASFTIGGGFSGLSVHDTTMSWFDSLSFDSYRFVQNVHDPHYHANRDTQVFPEERSYRTKDGKVRPSVADPLDDVSLVYLVRTLPLEPGQCYVFRRYFQPEGNPVVVHVVRRDTVEVPAGRFVALLLRPQITTSRMFSKNGSARLWLSDDSARTVVRLETNLGFGSIDLYLRQIGPDPRR